jgi:hypothetical protein
MEEYRGAANSEVKIPSGFGEVTRTLADNAYKSGTNLY